jgi:hypothetical protein
MEEPRRAMLRSEKLLPRDTKSSTDRVLANVELPYTESDEETRAQERMDTVDPMCTKSRMLNVEPKREAP